jgi:type I restriction enzyme S subunit
MSTVEGWEKNKLGNICSIEIGGTPSRNNPQYWDTDNSTLNYWVSIRDLNKRTITNTNERLSNLGVRNSNVKLQKKGTVLLSFKLSIGRTAFAGIDLFTNEAIAGLSTDSLDNCYLYYGLQHWDLLKGVDQAIKGATLNKAKLKEIEIFYPESIQEQTKIAEILSCIDTAIEKTEAMIAKQQRIKTGLMQDLLSKGIDEHGNIRTEQTHAFKDSELGRIPVEWEVKTVGEVMNIIDPNPSHRYPETSDIGVPLVSTENFSGDSDYDLTFAERVPFELFEQQKRRFQFSHDDVIFARKGRIGLARLYGLEQKVFSHTVVIIKPKNNLMNAHFILWSVRAQRFFDEIEKRMNSNSGVPTLGVEFIKAIPTTMPEINEQLRIVDALNKTELQATHELKKLAKLKRQKTALMQDLLSGNVRVNHLLKTQEIA